MVVAPDQESPRWLKVFGGFSAICLAAFAVVLVLPDGRFTGTLLNVADDPALAFAVVALLYARSRSRGAMHTVWGLFAAGMAAWLVGEIVSEVRGALGPDSGAETSVADVFYLLFYPPVMVGLVLFGREDRRAHSPGETLDATIVMGGVGLLLWALVRQTSLTAAGDLATQAVDVAYVALGLGLLWMLVLPVLRTKARWTRSRTLMACAFAGIVVADALWAATATDAYGLIASSSAVLLGIAAASDPDPKPVAPDPAAARRHHLIIEFAVVSVGAVAGAFMTTLAVRDGSPVDLIIGAAALLGLVLARLVVSISVNDNLLRASDRRASTDPLTGLLNHGSFHEHLAREIARARRSAASLALLYVDVDHFKAINDLGGHRAGDSTLTDVAGVLRATCRETDLVCRVGGDEMAIIAPATDLQQARELADRLTRAVHAIWAGPAHARTQVSLSVGLSVLPAMATTKARLMAQADAALYAAKERGRDGWMAFDPRSQFEEIPEQDLSRARAELAGRGSDFRAVFTHALEPMIITDHAPVILEANDAAAQLAGVSRERLIGRNLADFVTGTDDALLSRILGSIEVSSREVGTIPVVFPGRPEALLEFAASRFSPDRTLVALRDITDRTRAQSELARSEARFRGLFDGAHDAIFITDDTGVITDANPAAAKLTGHTRHGLLGMSVADLGRDEDRERIKQATQELLRENVLIGTDEFVDDTGQAHVVEYTTVANIVPGEHLSIVRDITGRAAAQRELTVRRAPAG